MLCSEERAKRVSEARSQRAGQSRHGIMLEQVKQQQQAAQQAVDEADPDAPAQPAAPEERNLTLMIKADVQVCNAALCKILLCVLRSAYRTAAQLCIFVAIHLPTLADLCPASSFSRGEHVTHMLAHTDAHC